jgi:hypothetical protein
LKICTFDVLITSGQKWPKLAKFALFSKNLDEKSQNWPLVINRPKCMITIEIQRLFVVRAPIFHKNFNFFPIFDLTGKNRIGNLAIFQNFQILPIFAHFWHFCQILKILKKFKNVLQS